MGEAAEFDTCIARREASVQGEVSTPKPEPKGERPTLVTGAQAVKWGWLVVLIALAWAAFWIASTWITLPFGVDNMLSTFITTVGLLSLLSTATAVLSAEFGLRAEAQ